MHESMLILESVYIIILSSINCSTKNPSIIVENLTDNRYIVNKISTYGQYSCLIYYQVHKNWLNDSIVSLWRWWPHRQCQSLGYTAPDLRGSDFKSAINHIIYTAAWTFNVKLKIDHTLDKISRKIVAFSWHFLSLDFYFSQKLNEPTLTFLTKELLLLLFRSEGSQD